MATATRKPTPQFSLGVSPTAKEAGKPATVNPAPARVTGLVHASAILTVFRDQAESSARRLTELRAELAQAVLDGHNMAQILGGSEKITAIEAAENVRDRVLTIVAGGTEDTYELTMRERLAFLIEVADHETGYVVRCQAWNVRSTNPVHNALEIAQVNATLKTWMEIAEVAKGLLKKEIVEGPAEIA